MKEDIGDSSTTFPGKVPVTLNIKILDITLEETEILVNSVNPSLKLGHGISGIFLKTGGPKLQEECDSFKKLQVTKPIANGSVIKTGTGYFTSSIIKHIYHCVTPNYNYKNSLNDLKLCFKNCLELADQEGMKSIAFPALGTGRGNFPGKDCAINFFKAFDEFLKSLDRKTLQNVTICLINEDLLKVFNTQKQEYLSLRAIHPYGNVSQEVIVEQKITEEIKVIRGEGSKFNEKKKENKVTSWRKISLSTLLFTLFAFSFTFFLVKYKDRNKNR
jgi:O-acetyl-ADP-ribose deacetylase (regulator of RNase III)